MTNVDTQDIAEDSHKIRWRWVAIALAPFMVFAGILALLLPGWWGVGFMLLCAALLVRPAVRMSRQTLTMTAAGLTNDRVRYRISASWEDVLDVRARRAFGFRLHELHLKAYELEKTGRISERTMERLVAAKATVRVSLTPFDPHWQDGRAGEALRAHGLLSPRSRRARKPAVAPAPVAAEPVAADPVQPEAAQPEPVQAEPAQPEAVQAEAAQPEPVQAEAAQPEPGAASES